jgi:hypothetical protein
MSHPPVRDRRGERGPRARPEVLIYYIFSPNAPVLLRQVTAGLEEEGVPYRLVRETDGEDADGGAAGLASAAARESALEVGIGVSAAGDVCVHQAKLPPGSPALSGPPATARIMGHNAARIVTGIPLLDPGNQRNDKDVPA